MIFIIYVIIAGDDSGHCTLQVLQVFLHQNLKTDDYEKRLFSQPIFRRRRLMLFLTRFDLQLKLMQRSLRFTSTNFPPKQQ